MKSSTCIVWFRQDLRLHDNEALTDALANGCMVVPVYVFDNRIFGGSTKRFGFEKTGAHRLRFIIESVSDLRKSLRDRGSDLIVRIGKPEEIVAQIARELRAGYVFCNRERTQEEVAVQDELEKNLWEIGQELRFVRGKMLLHTADLPFPVTHTPDVFTQFRKEVEKIVPIREPFPIPEVGYADLSETIESGEIPTLTDFGLDEVACDDRSVLPFRGGETVALQRLDHFFEGTNALSTYKENRNGLIGADYSSKFSPWLAQGCLSPKYIYHRIKVYEAQHGANDSSHQLILELMWRDFFRLMLKKHGDVIFQKGGTKRESRTDLKEDKQLLKIWIEGRTGIPLIDANMRELAATGFMSSRGRYIVSSFLINDLKISWQMGAEYFESMLIDYDPCSNYGNWNYMAGVGSDPRENRYQNIMAQARKYDPEGGYIRHWIPELAMLPKESIHMPDNIDADDARQLGFQHGSTYPRPMIDVSKW